MALSNEDLKAIESLLEPIKHDIKSIQLTQIPGHINRLLIERKMENGNGKNSNYI